LCPMCLAISKDAFISGVNDYFLLFKPSITNAECRNFLHIPTVDTTQKILLLLNLPSEGNTRNRVYFPPSEQFYIEKVPHAFQNKRK
jgi:hypothetical protein